MGIAFHDFLLARLAALGLALWASLPVVAGVEVVHRGIPHDALYGIALEGSNALAVGAGGLLLGSRDGGATWQAHAPRLTELALLDVALRGEYAIVVGQMGRVFVRQGSKWRAVESGTESRLLAVDIDEKGHAVAVGGFGTLLVSEDGGASWRSVMLDWESLLDDFIEPHLYDVHVADDGVVTVVGEFGLVLRSEDGGTSWLAVNRGESSLFALALRDDGTGVVVGQEGKALRTGDGGRSWESLDTGSATNLLGAWLGDGDTLFVTGMRTARYRRGGGLDWQAFTTEEVSTGWYQGVVGAAQPGPGGGVEAYAVGHQGSIVRLRPD